MQYVVGFSFAAPELESMWVLEMRLVFKKKKSVISARSLHSSSSFQILRKTSCEELQPIADRVAQHLEIISKKFQISTMCTRILMGFTIYFLVVIVNPMGRILVRWRVLEIISRCCATLSAIGNSGLSWALSLHRNSMCVCARHHKNKNEFVQLAHSTVFHCFEFFKRPQAKSQWI